MKSGLKLQFPQTEDTRADESADYKTSPRNYHESLGGFTPTEFRTGTHKRSLNLNSSRSDEETVYSPSIIKKLNISFSDTPREFVPVPGNPEGLVTPENYMLLVVELERLMMVNRALLQENEQLISTNAKSLGVEKLLQANAKLNEEIALLRKKIGLHGQTDQKEDPLLCIDNYWNSQDEAKYQQTIAQQNGVIDKLSQTVLAKDREVERVKQEAADIEKKYQELLRTNRQLRQENIDKQIKMDTLQSQLMQRAAEEKASLRAEFKAKMDILESKALQILKINQQRESDYQKILQETESRFKQLLESSEREKKALEDQLLSAERKLQTTESGRNKIKMIGETLKVYVNFLGRKPDQPNELNLSLEEAKRAIRQLTEEKDGLGELLERIDTVFRTVNTQRQKLEREVDFLLISSRRMKQILVLKEVELRELVHKHKIELKLSQEEIEKLFQENCSLKLRHMLVCLELERLLNSPREIPVKSFVEMKDASVETDPFHQLTMSSVVLEDKIETEPSSPVKYQEDEQTQVPVTEKDLSSDLSSDESDDEVDDFEFTKTMSYRRGGLLDGAKDPKRRESVLMQFKRFQVIAQEVEDLFKKYDIKRISMVLGIDCTASNTWSGKKSFGGKNLHHISRDNLNFYEQAFGILGSVVERFDASKSIPSYFFGDREGGKESVTPLFHDKDTGSDALPSLDMVLRMYRRKIKIVKLGGHTSFVPLIKKTIEIVSKSRVFHILVIIGDGGVTDIKANSEAVCMASEYPLGILFVGVGDGDYKDNPKDPWYRMKQLADELPNRKFDNFNFILVKPDMPPEEFAKKSLVKVPKQYIYCRQNGMIDE